MEVVCKGEIRPSYTVETHDVGYGSFTDDENVALAAQHRRCPDGIFRTLYRQSLKASAFKKTKRALAQRKNLLRRGLVVKKRRTQVG